MFDIHQNIRDSSGRFDDEKFQQYAKGLFDAFANSPEGESVIERQGNVGWTGVYMDYAMNHLGVTPADMTVQDSSEVVFTLFPKKLSVEPERAEEIVEELAAFWRFAERQYGLPQAKEISETLAPDQAAELRRMLADPTNYEPAKSLYLSGVQAGYDMTSEQGVREFMLAYNASMAAQNGPLVFGGSPSAPSRSAEDRKKLQKARHKQRRKLTTVAKRRKRNSH
jgi:hypothetical protein